MPVPRNQLILGNCLVELQKLLPRSVDLVLGSPPYAEKGERYGKGSKPWPTEEWIEWMFQVTMASLSVSRNLVIWIVNGSVKNGHYLPACEGLVYRLYKEAAVMCERPCIWHKNAPPNRRDWFGNDWEYCLVFRPEGGNRYFDAASISSPPKYSRGGRFRQRTKTGDRRLGNEYPTNALARPRDVIRATVGGGHMGSKLAHINVAPFPESIVEPFVLSCCPSNGIVLDPFCGSGTTLAVAERRRRRWIGIDQDPQMIALSRNRVNEVLLGQTVIN
jgi:site-specific DNA-methyltransferase (adenine-specific)/site-specific DNA-methyltransferase (cytosine-N4-specific)